MVADIKLDHCLILAFGHPARAICLADGGVAAGRYQTNDRKL